MTVTVNEANVAIVKEAREHFSRNDLSGGVRTLIASATDLAGKAQFGPALELFQLARHELNSDLGSGRVAAAVKAMRGKLAQERSRFRQSVAERAPLSESPARLIVFADSLGLPREEETNLEDGGVPATYACRIQTLSGSRTVGRQVHVFAECQRYFTSQDVLSRLVEMRNDLQGAFLLVHVGLNDCASRIFSETERAAVTLLEPDVQEQLLAFVRKHRRIIIHRDPEYNYVPLPNFIENLEKIVKVARVNGARHVAFVTIVQPGLARELHTPHLRWNFTRYNFAIYDVAKRMSVLVIDADRLCWDAGLANVLNRDGMHLAAPGHDMLAHSYLNAVKPKLVMDEL